MGCQLPAAAAAAHPESHLNNWPPSAAWWDFPTPIATRLRRGSGLLELPTNLASAGLTPNLGRGESWLYVTRGDTAEIDFVRTCGLTPERVSVLGTELNRNKVVSVEIGLDAAVAAKFRYARA